MSGEPTSVDPRDEKIAYLLGLLRDAPVLFVNMPAAAARDEKCMMDYWRLMADWMPRVKDALRHG